MISLFKKDDAEKKALREEVTTLKDKVKDLEAVVNQLHDTVCIVTAAQYQIGNDVSAIYTALKTATKQSSMEDDIFSFKKDDDDKGYLN